MENSKSVQHSCPNPTGQISKNEKGCQPILEMMTKNVITVSIDGTLKEALQIFRTHKIRHVIVVDAKNVPKGVFSKRDLLMLQSSQNAGPLMEKKVISSATMNPIMMDMYTCIRVVAQSMIDNKIGCVPIVSNSTAGTLVGIVTESDFVKAYASQVQCYCTQIPSNVSDGKGA